MVAEFKEVVAQRGDVHVGRYADGDLRAEHLRTGLHGAVARALQVLDGDALAVEEIGQLEQDARFVGGDHLDDVILPNTASRIMAIITISGREVSRPSLSK